MENCWFCYQVTNEGEYHQKCSRKFFGTNVVPELELNNNLLKDLADRTINNRIALTGVQPKLSVSLQKSHQHNRLTIVGLWGEYILKPQHPLFAQMPQTEDLTMHIASLFKLPVCGHALIKATDGNFVYLAKRFDRQKEKKIHAEDMCQLSGFLTENKYKSSYERIGKIILKYCTNSGLDAINYFELVLFSFLSGNNDMHLKNFSVLHQGDNILLSPAYDLINVNLVNPKDEEELALTLNAKKKKIKISDFIVLGESLKISSTMIRNSFNKFQSKNMQVKQFIEASFLGEEEKELYYQIWMKKQAIFEL